VYFPLGYHLRLTSSGLYEISLRIPGRYLAGCMKKYESHPGVETPDTPDGSDELDACDVLRGLGLDVLASGCQVRRVGWWKVSWVARR
jgi:hypothetical protein